MKVIFLDVDGVLNTRHNTTVLGLSRGPLRNLEWLVEQTGASLILSSSWRLSVEASIHLKRILDYRGLKIVGQTPVSYGFRRDDIEQWVIESGAGLESYVILDDEPNSMFYDYQRPRHVETDMEHGLTREHAERARRILCPE